MNASETPAPEPPLEAPDAPDEPLAPAPTTPVLSDTRHNAIEAVTWPVRVAAAWAWRIVLIGATAYLTARALGKVGLVVFAFIIALFLTAILHPIEVRLRQLPGRKSLSALLALLIGLIVVGGLGWFVVWQITSHQKELADQLTTVVDNTKHWLETGPLHVKSSDLDKVSTNLSKTIQEHGSTLVSGAIDTVKAVSEFLAAFLLILLTTFYLLRDGALVWQWVVRLFPRASRERLDFAGRAGWGTFGGYMRGQLLIALFHGVTTTILLLILRVPLAAALGVLIFLGSFIPVIGLVITGALAVAIALLEHGATTAVVVAIAIVVLVQVEGHVLQPFIMSRSVNVHPLAIVLAVIAGTTLKGIPGALIAVPLVAFVNTSVKAMASGPVDASDDVTADVEGELPKTMLQEQGEAPASRRARLWRRHR